MSRFPQSFYALGRRWARPDASRANWSLPPFEEAERLAREADMPWLSEEARAEFAKHPELQGWSASGIETEGQDPTGLGAEHESPAREAGDAQ